jgi:two-component system NtrC family sensor kinase
MLLLAGIILYVVNLRRVRAEEAERHIAQAQSYQEKLNQAAKLASIGELVDSVAHEINTPTGIISTVTDTLLLQDCAKLKCADDLNVLRDQVKRIKKYTKSLLGFSRRLPFQPKRDNLPVLIDECIFLVSPRLRSHRIMITKNFPDVLPQFIFDRARIEQVIINLLNNAIDFVDRDGKIQIDLEIKPAEKGQDFNQWICIAISDNGKGISAADIPFLFEPFFSTKPIAKGTGLGLAISKTIIERHNGKITVDSRPNQGSTFSVYLPFLTN